MVTFDGDIYNGERLEDETAAVRSQLDEKIAATLGDCFGTRIKGAYFKVQGKVRTVLRNHSGGDLPSDYDHFMVVVYRGLAQPKGRVLLKELARGREDTEAVRYVAERVATALVPSLKPSIEYHPAARLQQSLDYVVDSLKQG